MKIVKKIESDEDIRLELIRDNKLSSNENTNYINNKELYEEYKKYHQKKLEWEAKGLGVPPLTNTIGKAILQIAKRRCNSWYKVKNYSQSWKEEMISLAVMYCTLRGHNFDPERFDNPFSYLTQICNNAILEQLKRERSNLYVRYKSIEEASGFLGQIDEEEINESDLQNDMLGNYASEERRSYIKKFEDGLEKKKLKRAEKSNVDNDDDGKVKLF